MSGRRVEPAACFGSVSALDGFVLAMALFTLVLIGAVVAGGYVVAAQRFRAAEAGTQGSSAFYAAEAGLGAAMAAWSSAGADSLAPGAAALLVSGQLTTGDRYEVRLSRLDDGASGQVAYYLLEAAGHAHGPHAGQRRVALLLRRVDASGFCCSAALAAVGDVSVADGALVTGYDRVPDRWPSRTGDCGRAGIGDRPGILSLDSDRVTLAPGASVMGVPPIAMTRAETGPWADFDLRRADWARLADVAFESGTGPGSVGPATGADGGCDLSAPGNWGAPGRPDHPCFDYFPLIHARGDLTIDSPGSGQGILVVDGDLSVGAAFEFFGVVLVAGGLRLTGEGAGIHGTAVVASGSGEGVVVGGGAVVGYSACAVGRAVAGSKLQLPRPLAQFSWFEILE